MATRTTPNPFLLPDRPEIVVGVVDGFLSRSAGADDDEGCRRCGFVDELVGVRRPGRKAGEGAGGELLLAIVVDERHGAGEDVDELVLGLVPVPQRRNGTRLESHVV